LRGLFAGRADSGEADVVALAEILDVPLVTEDRAILKCWPGHALSLEAARDIQ